MARIPQGILGGLRGRVGNIIGASWKGINYIRSMPLSVANPNTSLQQAQRGAFTQCVAAARLLIADLIATYWDPFARSMSGYNHFISQNIDAFATAGFSSPANFHASRGILTGFAGFSAEGNDGVGMTVTFTDNSGIGDALATDELISVWYNVTQGYWKFLADDTKKRDGSPVAVPDTVVVENDVVEYFAFLVRPDLEKISDSSHSQVTIAA